MKEQAYEVNFDGIIGPTHNFGGLSYGNKASMTHKRQTSNPKEAALEGLEKMNLLMDLGLKQGVLPPHERPHILTLRSIGFSGTDNEILHKVFKESPELLSQVSSSAFMWAANAATFSPSSDCLDRKCHFTPANLTSNLHRSIECETTSRLLRTIFCDQELFTHHSALPCGNVFADEGAANHTRFYNKINQAGLELFVYGRSAFKTNHQSSPKFPARQTEEASRAIARLHQLNPHHTIYAQQNLEAIESGVFHNDVISVGNGNVFLYHEKAFSETSQVILQLQQMMEKQCHTDMCLLPIMEKDLSFDEAVACYLFNSQLITQNDESMALIAPIECQENHSVKALINSILSHKKNPVDKVYYRNLRESMYNGGGPACLRLRVVLTDKELASIKSNVLLTPHLYKQLKKWIQTHYRETLDFNDLGDPELLKESQNALDELTNILKIGSFYSFQK